MCRDEGLVSPGQCCAARHPYIEIIEICQDCLLGVRWNNPAGIVEHWSGCTTLVPPQCASELLFADGLFCMPI